MTVFNAAVGLGVKCAVGEGNDLSAVSEIDRTNSVIATGRRCVSCMCLWL